MDNGNLGIGLHYTYAGNPTGVSTQAFNPPKGSFVIDTATPALWQKTSTANNSGFVLIATGSGALTPSSIAATGAVTSSSPSGGVGYATGAGGAVTQATNKTTGVTLNTVVGAITMNNAALAGGAEAAFTLTNSSIGANDITIVVVKSGGTSGAYGVDVTATAAGSCEITLSNLTVGSLSEAVVLSFIVFRGAIA